MQTWIFLCLSVTQRSVHCKAVQFLQPGHLKDPKIYFRKLGREARTQTRCKSFIQKVDKTLILHFNCSLEKTLWKISIKTSGKLQKPDLVVCEGHLLLSSLNLFVEELRED
jgi:hypothetical protein